MIDRERFSGGSDVEPLPGKEHGEGSLVIGGRRTAGSDLHDLSKPVQKCSWRGAPEVVHHPVVGKYLELLAGKEHGEEKIDLVVVVEAPSLLASRRSGATRRSGAVMTIRDVERRDLPEGVLQLAGIGDPPDGVRHSVGRHEIVERCLGRSHGIDGRVDPGGAAIGQKDGPGVRRERQDVPRAIVFLIGSRLLVLLDEVVVVLVNRGASDHADLRVVSHDLPIEVESLLIIAKETALFDQPLEGPGRLRIHGVVMDIGLGRQVDLGPHHMEEAVGIAGSELAGLGRVDDVVGNAGYLGSPVGSGAQGAE